MTYMSHADFASAGGIQELNFDEIEGVDGGVVCGGLCIAAVGVAVVGLLAVGYTVAHKNAEKAESNED